MRRAILLTVAVLAAGCGSDGLASVRGRLVYPEGQQAKELAGCSVVFEGTANGKAVGSTGEVDSEGRFELTTNRAGDGAAVGTNKVAINPRWPGGSERPDPLPVLEKYRSTSTSELSVEVKPGRNDVTIIVEPKAKKAKK